MKITNKGDNFFICQSIVSHLFIQRWNIVSSPEWRPKELDKEEER